MRGLGYGAATGAEAHERWGAGALPRAGHGDGEVAAAELAGAVWQGEDCSSAEGSEARGLRGCRVWRWSSRRWPVALLGGRRRRSVPAAEGAEWERGGRRELD